MSGAKEIRTKISSVKSTQKITSAMEMVAASKMRKAQERMEVGKPYAKRIRAVIGHVANAASEYKHPFMESRDVKRLAIVVISSDRGLCGGLNTNVFKQVVKTMQQAKKDGIDVELCTIGSKAQAFFGGLGGNIVASVRDIGEQPAVTDIIGAIKVVIDRFESGEIDKVVLASNEYVNTMTQQPTIEQILPLEADEESQRQFAWDYIYEPDAKELLDGLLLRFLESQVYQAVIENAACEQAARMLAMKNATENAGTIIDDLQMIYNRARQASITQELSEIVGGAAAV
ncbi:MAG: F0F1 ATP synthase subunit gamma [Cellvibrionales bacterium]|nr:F0F1 ATP synthase subunit gamma [Cellvibrionales bacterium]